MSIAVGSQNDSINNNLVSNETKYDPIDVLPPEIFQNVLSYFDNRQDLANCRDVAWKWHARLAKHAFLWNEITRRESYFMFSSLVSKVISYMETNTLCKQSFYEEGGFVERFVVRMSLDSHVSHAVGKAVGNLLKLNTPFSDEGYSFFYDSFNGLISIEGKEEGKKVNSIFMEALKTKLSQFAQSMSTSWEDCSQNKEVRHNPFLSFRNREKIVYKPADGAGELYHYLNHVHKNLVYTLQYYDTAYIAGRKENIQEFLECLRAEGINIKYALGFK